MWAQTGFDQNPDAYRVTLDLDRDGIACPDLPASGFTPVVWTDRIPEGVAPAQVVSVTVGDTLDVTVGGVQDMIRTYHIDSLETSNLAGGPHCGGTEATDYLGWVPSFAPGGTVYLEYDQTQRDRFDCRLAYVWYQIGGDVYLVAEVMVRNSRAESETYEADAKYRDQGAEGGVWTGQERG